MPYHNFQEKLDILLDIKLIEKFDIKDFEYNHYVPLLIRNKKLYVITKNPELPISTINYIEKILGSVEIEVKQVPIEHIQLALITIKGHFEQKQKLEDELISS